MSTKQLCAAGMQYGSDGYPILDKRRMLRPVQNVNYWHKVILCDCKLLHQSISVCQLCSHAMFDSLKAALCRSGKTVTLSFTFANS